MDDMTSADRRRDAAFGKGKRGPKRVGEPMLRVVARATGRGGRTLGARDEAAEAGVAMSYYLTGTVAGVRVRRSLGLCSSKRQARLVAERLRVLYEAKAVADPGGFLRDLGVESELGVKWEEACEHYMRHSRWDGDAGYMRRVTDSLRGVPVGMVDQAKVEAAIRKVSGGRKGGKAADSTVRRMMNQYAAVLNHAHAQGWCRKVTLRKPEDGEARLRWLSEEEIEFLERALPPLERDLFVMLVYTGARMKEVWQLEWADVGENGVVLASRKGTGGLRKRLVPLHAKVRDVLMRRPSREGRVWPEFVDANRMSKFASDMFKAAGVDGVTAHVCRHTFISHLVMRGVDIVYVKELAGHAKIEMTLRYAHLAPHKLQAQVDRL